jgi:hypothetical protein
MQFDHANSIGNVCVFYQTFTCLFGIFDLWNCSQWLCNVYTVSLKCIQWNKKKTIVYRRVYKIKTENFVESNMWSTLMLIEKVFRFAIKWVLRK